MGDGEMMAGGMDGRKGQDKVIWKEGINERRKDYKMKGKEQ